MPMAGIDCEKSKRRPAEEHRVQVERPACVPIWRKPIVSTAKLYLLSCCKIDTINHHENVARAHSVTQRMDQSGQNQAVRGVPGVTEQVQQTGVVLERIAVRR